MEPTPTPFDLVCAALGGTQKAIAAALDVSQPTVHEWKTKGFPVDRCERIELLTGIPCETLRADYEWARDEAGRPFYRQKAA
jgi:DNA-binding transcriptional regulator YdaS (Cro superfamily)